MNVLHWDFIYCLRTLRSVIQATTTFLQTTLIHLGAKYAPCMRWDETLSREIKEARLKERDTACCIRKDRAGCVQSPKTECTKVGGETAGTDSGGKVSMSVSHPRSNWVS